MQELAWQISVTLILVLLLVFLFVLARSGREVEYEPIQRRTGRIRAAFFWLLILVCTPVIIVSLTDLPYTRAREPGAAPQTITATGHQWRWVLSQDQVVAGRPVEFHVTSADVNHGFGIYDDNLTLLAQTQAMPNYVNKLRYTFTRPGVYKVLCLEYCGLGHHTMIGQLTVRSK